jgi:hypothetical protein
VGGTENGQQKQGMDGMGGGARKQSVWGYKHAAVMHCRRVPLAERSIVFVICSNNLEN